MEQGTILVVQFSNDNYIDFIQHCFMNVLISGVDIKNTETGATLFIRLAAPGIDRIHRSILKFKGNLLEGI